MAGEWENTPCGYPAGDCVCLANLDVGQLAYEGNSVSFIHQKMKAYRAGIDAAWNALREAGIHPDGKTSVADGIRALADRSRPL